MPSTTTTTDPEQQPPSSSPIHSENNEDPPSKNPKIINNAEENSKNSTNNGNNKIVARRERPSRACTQRAAQRMQQAAAAEAALAAAEKKRKSIKRKERMVKLLKEVEMDEDEEEEEEEGRSRGSDDEDDDNGGPLSSRQQCSGSSKAITPLVAEPEASQLPRWNIRSMWQLASILNFFNVFRPLLNIKVEFSAEEFETALLNPNRTLGDIHMPLLKAIPPITRTALGHNTWITVLCRKLRDWWHWVAEGELPIVAAQGAEIEAYNALDPGVRVVILKALCDIRVEQEDIRNYIDDSIKRGIHLSTFRKERIGGDSQGVSYWYEDDPEIGHRLYREIRKVEVKRGKGKNVPPIPNSSYQWEAVGTNFDELQDVSEKLFLSQNRTEASLGKKLKRDMLPEIEKVHRKKEKLLKKQHRQALLLDNMINNVDGLIAGRSLRDRKPVTYTFDDYDRSINEALKETQKKQISPDPTVRRDVTGPEVATNGGVGPSQFSRHSFSRNSPKSSDSDESGEDHKFDTADRSNRRRKRPQRYSVKDYVEGESENDDDDFDSDDDVVGEVVYDDEYMSRKQGKKLSSSSEGDEEYKWDDENPEDDEEDEDEEEEENDSSSASDDSDRPRPRKFKKLQGRTRRGTKLRSVDDLQSGLRRSNRATRNRINYQQIEWSESENELPTPQKSRDEDSHGSDNADFSEASQDSDENHEIHENHEHTEDMKVEQTVEEEQPEMPKEEQDHPPEKSNSPSQNEVEGVKKRRFLDLNELAPGSGFDDGSDQMKDDDADDF